MGADGLRSRVREIAVGPPESATSPEDGGRAPFRNLVLNLMRFEPLGVWYS